MDIFCRCFWPFLVYQETPFFLMTFRSDGPSRGAQLISRQGLVFLRRTTYGLHPVHPSVCYIQIAVFARSPVIRRSYCPLRRRSLLPSPLIIRCPNSQRREVYGNFSHCGSHYILPEIHCGCQDKPHGGRTILWSRFPLGLAWCSDTVGLIALPNCTHLFD